MPTEASAFEMLALRTEDGKQAQLLNLDEYGEEVALLERQEGRYTAERALKLRPQQCALALTLLADGRIAKRQICKVSRLHWETVEALAKKFPDIVEAEKKRLGAKCRDAANMLVERAMEVIPDLPMDTYKDVLAGMTSAGILIEKSELLTGGATHRVETVEKDTWRELRDVVPGLKRGGAVIEAELVPETGLGAGARETNSGALAPAQGASGAAVGLPGGAAAGPQASGLPANEGGSPDSQAKGGTP